MIISELEKVIKRVFDKLDYKLDEVKVIKSNRKDLCDYQCDDIFRISKTYHKNPIVIGEEIVEEIKKIDNYDYYFRKVEFVKPGFINIKIGYPFLNHILVYMNDNEKFGIKKPTNIDTYVIDYGGPNVAKPLHVGHLRPAIIGESIKRIINYVGHKIVADVHLGDYGLQIGEVIYGLLEDKKNIDEITLDYLQEIYPKMSKLCKENKEILDKCSSITKELQDGNLEYQKLWKKIYEVSVTDIKKIYEYLDVSFDLWKGESDSYPYMEELIEFLKPYTKSSENAKVIEVKKETDTKEMPPLILQKSNGAYLYATTDLATILQREKDYKPDYIIYVADNRQTLHFEQIFRVCKLSNLTNAKLEHATFGTVNGTDGKPFKTRNGDMLSLETLIEDVTKSFIELKEDNEKMDKEDVVKIVNAIIKYADLQNNRERDYIFDIAKFSSVIGKTGPYILYTYLRINKILKDEKFSLSLSDNIYNEQDLELRMKITDLHQSIDSAFKLRLPNYIADYIYELCVSINIFYQNNHISNLDDKVKKNDWLYVLNLSSNVLKEMLNLLVIEIPNEM